jgi:type II secretory pathway pseudopilin PulG
MIIASKKNIKNKLAAGFTLVELMVAVSIYIIMSVILMASQDKFNDSMSFSNLGYDVALTMRQAQTYGYSVRAAGSNTFVNAYGLHFSANNPSNFILFYEPVFQIAGSYLPATHLPPAYQDCQSDTSTGGCLASMKDISVYTLKNGYTLSKICYGSLTGCGQSNYNGCIPVQTPVDSSHVVNDYLDVIFQRPNTTAYILNPQNNGTGLHPQVLTQASVELTSPTGDKECVSVFQSGDIEVGSIAAESEASS